MLTSFDALSVDAIIPCNLVTARRQYVINLDAPNKITASDGETRIIGVAEIIQIEDLHGKGHLSQAMGQMRRSAMNHID